MLINEDLISKLLFRQIAQDMLLMSKVKIFNIVDIKSQNLLVLYCSCLKSKTLKTTILASQCFTVELSINNIFTSYKVIAW